MRRDAGRLGSIVRRPGARRTAWSVVDQGIASLANFAVVVIVARSVSVTSFGAFAVPLLVYTLVISVVRGVVSEPLAIRVSARSDQRAEVAGAAGAALVSGAAAGLLVLPVAAYLGGDIGAALAVTAVMLPALVLQDTWRFALFTMGRPGRAAMNDLAWAIVQTAAIVVVVVTTTAPVVLLTAAWAGAVLLPAALGARQTGVVPAVGQAIAYLHRHFTIGWRLASDALFRTGSRYLTMLIIGGILGAGAVGAIRGGSTLFGPFTVAALGLMSGGIAEGSRLWARAPHRLVPVLWVMTSLLVAVSVMWSVVLLAMPESWGRAMLGDTWPAASEVIVPFAAVTAGASVMTGAMLGLRIVSAASEIFRIRVIAGCVMVVAGASGAWLAGTPGGVWGLAAGNWVAAIGAWWSLARHRRGHPRVFAKPTRRRSALTTAGPDTARADRGVPGWAADRAGHVAGG